MNQITINFADRSEMYHFLENIANAQESLADKAEENGATPKDFFQSEHWRKFKSRQTNNLHHLRWKPKGENHK